jgi:hypothetical protein
METMWSYPMALIPQVLVAAVGNRSALGAFDVARVTTRRSSHGPQRYGPSPLGPLSLYRMLPRSRLHGSQITTPTVAHEPSFDDAVSFVGEYSGVRLCWIVDRDGLPVAVWQRQRYTGDAEFWAPISVQLVEFHRDRLSTSDSPCVLDRLEARTAQGRLMIEAVHDLWLGVLTDPDTDDLVSVRVTRARDMIAKNLQAEGGEIVAAGEAQYV